MQLALSRVRYLASGIKLRYTMAQLSFNGMTYCVVASNLKVDNSKGRTQVECDRYVIQPKPRDVSIPDIDVCTYPFYHNGLELRSAWSHEHDSVHARDETHHNEQDEGQT